MTSPAPAPDAVQLRHRKSVSSPSLPQLHRGRSVRASLRLIGSRWKTASALLETPSKMSARVHEPASKMADAEAPATPAVDSQKKMDVFKRLSVFPRDKSKAVDADRSRLSLFQKEAKKSEKKAVSATVAATAVHPFAETSYFIRDVATAGGGKDSALRSPRKDIGAAQKKYKRDVADAKTALSTTLRPANKTLNETATKTPKRNYFGLAQKKSAAEKPTAIGATLGKAKQVAAAGVATAKASSKTKCEDAAKPDGRQKQTPGKVRKTDYFGIVPKKYRSTKPGKPNDTIDVLTEAAASKTSNNHSNKTKSRDEASNKAPRRVKQQDVVPAQTFTLPSHRPASHDFVLRSDALYPSNSPLKRYELELLQIIEQLHSPRTERHVEKDDGDAPNTNPFHQTDLQAKSWPPKKASKILGITSPIYKSLGMINPAFQPSGMINPNHERPPIATNQRGPTVIKSSDVDNQTMNATGVVNPAFQSSDVADSESGSSESLQPSFQMSGPVSTALQASSLPDRTFTASGIHNPAFRTSAISLRELLNSQYKQQDTVDEFEDEEKTTGSLHCLDSVARGKSRPTGLGKKQESLGRFWKPSTPQMGRKIQLQQEHIGKIVGNTTKRRNSMWSGTIVSSRISKFDEANPMEFLVDGLNITTKANRNKKLTKVNQINIHLHALFAAVENNHVDRARTILESTDVDVNSVNSDGLSPLDVAVLSNNRQLSKMLVAFGGQEGNQFSSPDKLGCHLKHLLDEAERRVQDLGGEMLPMEDAANNNITNNNRSSFSIHSNASMTSCSGGGSDAATDKQLLLWEKRAKGLKKMLLGFDQARPPDMPFSVSVDVSGVSSVTLRFQEPEHQDSAICTKFKVEWSTDEGFSPLSGEREILDMKQMECRVTDLVQGERYYFRVACGNLKGFGNYRHSSPASVVPSSWRDAEGRDPRFAGRQQTLDALFDEVRAARPECAAEIKAATATSETPGVQRRNQKKKTTSIKQLFTVASKFQKNLRRGVYLACLLYHEDKVLVTNEDFVPVIEVDETYPSCIYNDFHWLMKVACTWDDVKSLKQDMEKSLSSSTVHFRIKLLQAAAQMQTALSIQDLGQLFHRPVRDSQGTLVISTVNYVRSPKAVSVLNSRWLPLGKVQKKLATHEEPNVGELLMASIQEQITYHQVSSIRLTKGLYLGYLKMRSSVDMLQVVVPGKTPNVLPHCKIRDNPHVSCEEWEWLKKQTTTATPRSKTATSPGVGDEATPGEDDANSDTEQSTEQQRTFVELIAGTAKRLFTFMDVPSQDAIMHRLYDAEVIDLSPEVSFLVVCPPAESACAVPGQRELLLQRGDMFGLPVQVFEMVHMGTYQRDVISRYSRLSCILELDTVLAHHTHREAFSSSEVTAAKDRLGQLEDFQKQLGVAWKGARWLMDVLTFARDRASVGIAMHALLVLSKEGTGRPGAVAVNGTSLKRSLLQLPPRDPKVVKSNSSRGSWPGPGVNPGSVACLLTTELSKSEQHLVARKNSATSSLSNCSSQLHGVDEILPANSNGSLAELNTRLPPSRSEDTLHQRTHTKTHVRSRSSTTSVSASSSPQMQPRPLYAGSSLLSVARSLHSLSSDDSTAMVKTGGGGGGGGGDAVDDDDEEVADTVVPAPGPGTLQVYAAYETGLATGTSLKLHVTPRTTVREVVDLVVKQLNMAVVLKGKDQPIYPSDKLHNFCLVAVIGARERCLRDDFKPLQLQNPWKKGRLYVRQKQDVLAALEQSSRHTAYL